MDAGGLELQNDLGKAHFQQELNRWFESRGIISDLRSHLRHLMITALQNTQIGLKPTDKTSPKAQALNLIVAEYLFRHGCHYTLSVFTSEVPTLANFSAINPGVVIRREKSSEAIPKRPQKQCFQEKEFEEIFNALGMTSAFEELGHLKARYFQQGYDFSLVEVFIQTFTEMSTKLEVRKNLESYEMDENRKLLSEKWSAKVIDILLGENIKSNQIAAIKQAILRITENEVKRLTEEDRKMQLRILEERENRIQEYLRKHEEEIFFRLTNAEKYLNERKDMIDEELADRQKHLTKMALEWNEKHEEILKLSKNFHTIENENMRLREKVEELEKENEDLKTEGEAQKKTIEQLRNEISALINKLKEVTDSNVILNEQIEVLTRRENKEVSVSHKAEEEKMGKNRGQSSLSRPINTTLDNENSSDGKESNDSEQKSQNTAKVRATSPVKSRLGLSGTNQKQNTDLSDDENDFSSHSFSSDTIITNVRKNLQALEEETDRINKNYLDYKLKSQDIDSDSETSIAGSDQSPEKVCSPKVYTEVIKESRFCQTVSPNIDVENIFRDKKQEETNRPADCYDQNRIEKSQEVSFEKSEIRMPTKRQQKNREFFLKSRQLLQEFEKQKMEELNARTPSLIESSFQNLTSSSSEEIENIRECTKRSSKELELLSPLRTASLYTKEEVDIRKELPAGEDRKKEVLNQLSKTDITCLALLEETRIKSPRKSGRRTLQHQTLLLETNSDDEKKTLKEDRSNKSLKSLISSPNSSYDGKVSVGRKSRSDGGW